MTNSRRKGADGEREWAAYLRGNGIDARRGQQFSGSPDSPDVVSDLDEWFHAEVKRVEALRLHPAMEQAESDAGDGKVPYVAYRKNRKPWIVLMRAQDAIPLMLAAVRGGWTPEELT